ncbi:NADPH-dependent FMN reductase [Reinekea marinisedimentorum]|uniref:Chromate reductase n=1 Tax=Reinekea marinisedimentorum TaxID=230495 RepID=A0A4R3I3X7_9GAMM|nr:NAD(P)H-dependent oxidoreductase [Reinekea marinisedimentorum]TCS39763.1 chromate reductase [Reinekea marinisedimentorum]
MRFICFSGSFHSKSKSIAILECIKDMFAEHEFEILPLASLPFFSNELNEERPASVQFFMSRVEDADGIICCTPEYNHSVPAVLKNAIDWASRPAFNSPLKGKPVSIITQAMSPVGGARAQEHLKLIFDSTLARNHICHEMMITDVNNIFDEHMHIVDAKVNERLQRHVSSFVEFVAG